MGLDRPVDRCSVEMFNMVIMKHFALGEITYETKSDSDSQDANYCR